MQYKLGIPGRYCFHTDVKTTIIHTNSNFKIYFIRFAQRAKAVRNKPKVNEIMNEATLTKRFAKECAEMKKLLDVEFERNKQLEVD